MKQYYFTRQLFVFVFSFLFCAISYAQVPTYYDGFNVNDTGETLKTNLSGLISTTHTTNLSYTPGVWDALKQTDLDPTDNAKVLLVYGYNDTDSDVRNDRSRSKDANGGLVGDWNREHTYPKSLGTPNLGTSGPGADAHHLRPSDVQFNSSRSNRRFGNASGNARAVGSNWYPGDEWKGDVARMMMYMYLRYGSRCLPTNVGTGTQNHHADMMDIFLEWNAADPVTDFELNRNALLEGIQGNRNPFIDNPAFATTIWGGPQAEDRFSGAPADTEAPTAPTSLVASDVTATEVVLSWNAATDNIGVTGYRIYNGATQIAAAVTTNYTAMSLTANTTYTFTVKAYDASGNLSVASNEVLVTTLDDDVIIPPSDAIVFQGYEASANDTWDYTASPTNCNDGGNDVWDIVTSVGSISDAKEGTSFFGIRDLEGNCGTADGGTLVFDAVDITSYTDVTLSFAVNVVGYDTANGDTISYEVFHDGATQGSVELTTTNPFSTTGWEVVSVTVPDAVSSVSFTVYVKQNGGSDYAGIDEVQVNGTAIVTTPDIVINESDADTAGVDTQEFVELFDGGAGNTALDGLVLVFYNGSNDQSYAAYDLDGYTTSATGYFVLGNVDVPNVDIVFASNGLQNGADGMALYTGDATDFPNGTAVATDNIVDAFVYDTNDGDDAGLLVLLNAGEEQRNEDDLGDKDTHSLQRLPNGQGGARNTSSFVPDIPTPGVANGAVVVDPVLLINELDADTAGTDTQEFVELYDGGAGNTALDGKVLVFYNGSNDESYVAYDLDGYTTDANGYFVLGNVDVVNVSIVFASNGLQNGADAVALYTGDATDFPNGTAVSTSNIIDAVVYDTNDGDDAGLLALLTSGDGQLNEDEKDDKDAHSLQRFENGSGDALSTATFTQALPTPGAANSNATDVVDLVINELDADTAGTDTKEFVELYDGGAGNTALDGFVLVLYNGSSDTSYNAIDLAGYSTNAEGYFVIGNVDVANVSIVIPSNGLQNGADAAALYSGDAADFPNGTAVTTANLIDAVVYDTNDSDDAGLLVLLNAGQEQLNEDELDDKDGQSLQRLPNGQGGARNTAGFAQATPTPGTENGAVITPTDPIAILAARNAAVGETVTITGVLTVADEFAGSAYLQDSTGAIAIFDESVHGAGVFRIGDSITVTGTRGVYNDQVQINPVAVVENNGTPTQPIVPLMITLAEMANHPGELVKIANPTFPKPGDVLFGNSNYNLTDASGSGELRIDNDVTAIVGFGQPESCTELIGVVGRFRTTYQLLPRMRTDMPCADKYQPSPGGSDVPKENTLDVVTWNIEWFGDEANSPAAGNANSDQIQKDSVKVVLQKLDADIYAVQEIADEVLFQQMVSELPGYDFVLSDATSYPNDTEGVKQKVGFIYKTSVVTVVDTKALLQTVHPYYNGGDSSALNDYPEADKTRFFASGRLPFLMTANVTINGSTQEINFVNLHARANSSNGPQGRYDMRKYDVEALKDTLDAQYATKNVMLLGDYNDDVDVTVADVSTTISTYENYTADTTNYNVVSKALSDGGFRSYVFRENMIDHIAFSDELFSTYLPETVSVHYEFYDNDYSRTASDHFPVSARFLLETLELGTITVTNVSCNGAADGTATVTTSGGVAPYSYEWSDGSSTTVNTIGGLEAGDHSVIVTDALGNAVTGDFVITEGEPITASITGDRDIYKGYGSAKTTLTVADIAGGEAPYTYEWSTGETTADITVRPRADETFTVTVTDVNGCSTTAEALVTFTDVRCKHRYHRNKVVVCHRGKRALCVSKWSVEWHLGHGDTLGSCDGDNPSGIQVTNLKVYPNPFVWNTNVTFKSSAAGKVDFVVYDYRGVVVRKQSKQVIQGRTTVTLFLGKLRPGRYYLKTIVDGKVKKTRVLWKRYW